MKIDHSAISRTNIIKPSPQKQRLYAMAMFVCRQKRVLVGHWPAYPSSASGLSAAAGPDHRCPRCFLPRAKLHPVKFYVSGGGLLVVLINAPHLLSRRSR